MVKAPGILAVLTAVTLLASITQSASADSTSDSKPATVSDASLIDTRTQDTRLMIRGWAYLGKDHRIASAQVRVTDTFGKRIAELSGTTGSHGEFAIPTDDLALPKVVVVHVRNGYVNGKRSKGRLSARVSTTGADAGLAYVTPVSTLEVALAKKMPGWSQIRIKREARRALSMPTWAPATSHIKHFNAHYETAKLSRHASRLGGLNAWSQHVIKNHLSGKPVSYKKKPRERFSGQPRSAASTAASIAWNVVANAAESCNPADSKVPGVGMLASAITKAGILSPPPGCDLAAIQAQLAAIKKELDDIEAGLSEQGKQIAQVDKDVKNAAYSNAVIAFTSPSAVETVQANVQVLVDSISSYTQPPSTTNQDGLGIPLDQIFSATEGPALQAANSLKTIAGTASGPSIDGWSTALARFQEPGVVLEGNGAKGLMRLGWEAVRTAGSFVDQKQLDQFASILNYNQSVFRTLVTQQIDDWRSQGVPNAVIVSRTNELKKFDDKLDVLRPSSLALPKLPESTGVIGPVIDPGTGLAWAVVCQVKTDDPRSCPADGILAFNANATDPKNAWNKTSVWFRATPPALGMKYKSGTSGLGWPTDDQLNSLKSLAKSNGQVGDKQIESWINSSAAVFNGINARPIVAPFLSSSSYCPRFGICDWNDFSYVLADGWDRSAAWGCSTYTSVRSIRYGCQGNNKPKYQKRSGDTAIAAGRMLISAGAFGIGPTSPISKVPIKQSCPANVCPAPRSTGVDVLKRKLVPAALPLVVAPIDTTAYLPFPG